MKHINNVLIPNTNNKNVNKWIIHIPYNEPEVMKINRMFKILNDSLISNNRNSNRAVTTKTFYN